MVVLSAGIVNSSGRIILARQFMDISRVRIEGLLSAFPRLRDASVKKQATYLNAGSVRYVYQPIEELYLVLVTTLHSNIVEDLATLQIMSRVVSESVNGEVNENSIEQSAFNIFFAFDEIIVVGKKESTTLEEVQKYLDMDSVEERLFLEKQEQQMEAARRTTKEQALLLREKRMMGISRGGGDPYGGFGSDSVPGAMGNVSGGEYNMGRMSSTSGITHWDPAPQGNMMLTQTSMPSKPVGGMALGKGKKSDRLELNLLSKVQKEIGVSGGRQAATPGANSTPAPCDFKTDGNGQENIAVTIEEKMAVKLSRDGEVESAEVKGELAILIKEAHCERVKLELGSLSESYTFKAHAKINKTLFSNEAVLAMVDGKPFPVNQTITILRWRAADEVEPPVVLTCWPEIGRMTVEYEVADAYDRVEELSVTIPLNGQTCLNATPTEGSAEVDQDSVQWIIPVCSSENRSGSIDITIAESSVECGNVLFPISVSFAASCSLANVSVAKVLEVQTEMPVRFSEDVRLEAQNYVVE